MKRLATLALSLSSVMLGGCAYATAERIESGKAEPKRRGIPFFAPKAMVVVSGTGTSTVVVPDCSKEYRLRFGSVLAKHKAKFDFANGMLTMVDSDQDTTALPLEIVKTIREAALAGKELGGAFSSKAEGGPDNRFGIYEIDCTDGKLSLQPNVTEIPTMPNAPPRQTFVVQPVSGSSPEKPVGQDFPKRGN